MMANIISKLVLIASLVFIVSSGASAATSHSEPAGNHPVTDAHLESEMEDAFGIEAGHPIHADAEHSSGGLPQLDPTWFASQIFWLTIVFVSLYLIFSRKILPELSSTIENRHERIQGDLEQAEKLKEEAEKVHEAYEEILGEARDKSSGALQKAEEKIKQDTAKNMDKFREKSLAETQEMEKNVDKAKQAAMKDMDVIAAEIASEAAERIVGIRADIKKAKTVVENLSKKAA